MHLLQIPTFPTGKSRTIRYIKKFRMIFSKSVSFHFRMNLTYMKEKLFKIIVCS